MGKRIRYLRENPFIILIFIPALIVLLGLNRFPYPSNTAEYSDIAVTHYPNAIFLMNAIKEHSVLPLWSNTIFSGYPFAANPLSGLFYPPGWLALIFPLPLGFNLVAAGHLAIAAFGMYFFLRNLKLGELPAVLGGILFAGMPKIFSHYGAGHLTTIYAISWTPWLLWSTDRYLAQNTRRRLLPAIFISLVILADVRWAAYTGLLWLFWALAHRPRINEGAKIKNNDGNKLLITNLRVIKVIVVQGFIGLLLSASLLMPFVQFIYNSTRQHLGAKDVLLFALPPVKLFGLIIPDYGGFHEWTTYFGLFGTLLLAIGIVVFNHKKEIRFWGFLFFFTLFWSISSNFGITNILGNIPLINLLRVPTRALFLTGFSLSVISAFIVDFMQDKLNENQVKAARLTTFGFAVVVIFFGSAVGLINGIQNGIQLLPIFVVGLLGVLMIAGLTQRRIKQNVAILLILIAVFDLAIYNFSVLNFRKSEYIPGKKSELLTYLDEQDGIFRVYSPSYSIPQEVGALHSIELVDGVDPMQINIYSEYMNKASGVPDMGYSVTIPSFSTGHPDYDNQQFVPNVEKLGYLNTKFLVSEFLIKHPDLQLLGQFDQTYLYVNKLALPRAWVEELGEDGDIQRKAIEGITLSPNRIEIEAEGPGVLVLSEVYYSGWVVTVDGKKDTLVKKHEILRGVRISEGMHDVDFEYQPPLISIGVGISLTTLLFVILNRYKYVVGKIYQI